MAVHKVLDKGVVMSGYEIGHEHIDLPVHEIVFDVPEQIAGRHVDILNQRELVLVGGDGNTGRRVSAHVLNLEEHGLQFIIIILLKRIGLLEYHFSVFPVLQHFGHVLAVEVHSFLVA